MLFVNPTSNGAEKYKEENENRENLPLSPSHCKRQKPGLQRVLVPIPRICGHILWLGKGELKLQVELKF